MVSPSLSPGGLPIFLHPVGWLPYISPIILVGQLPTKPFAHTQQLNSFNVSNKQLERRQLDWGTEQGRWRRRKRSLLWERSEECGGAWGGGGGAPPHSARPPYPLVTRSIVYMLSGLLSPWSPVSDATRAPVMMTLPSCDAAAALRSAIVDVSVNRRTGRTTRASVVKPPSGTYSK